MHAISAIARKKYENDPSIFTEVILRVLGCAVITRYSKRDHDQNRHAGKHPPPKRIDSLRFLLHVGSADYVNDITPLGIERHVLGLKARHETRVVVIGVTRADNQHRFIRDFRHEH